LLVHIDAYRLTTADAVTNLVTNLEQLGLEDYLDRARCVVVEWGEALLAPYPEAFAMYLDLPHNDSPHNDSPYKNLAGDLQGDILQGDMRRVRLQQHGQPLAELEADVVTCLEQSRGSLPDSSLPDSSLPDSSLPDPSAGAS
jgi:hypothetical protein